MLLGLFEEPGGGGAEKRQQRRPAEDVHIGHQRRLLLHQAVDQSHGAGTARGGSQMVAEIAGDGCGLLLEDHVRGVRLAPISFWCMAARRISAVVAIEIPIEPPMLRSMLKRPVALPISSRGIVEVAMVASGTKTKLSAKPVSVMGISSV